MTKNLLYPANLDLQTLIDNKLPEFNGDKNGITKENTAYVFHSIISQWLTYKKDFIQEKYKSNMVPLCSAYLRNILGDTYKNCLDFLLFCGVIVTDNKAFDGKCRKYAIVEEYIGKGYQYLSPQGRLANRLNDYYAEKQAENAPVIKPLVYKRGKLIKTLKSPLFTIETDAASNAVEQHFKEAWGKAIVKENNAAELVQLKINKDVSLELISRINNITDDDIIIDTSGNRLHTPITRLPKYLRGYLKYDGKNLVALDVKNSQPYFSIVLLSKAFYLAKSAKKLKGFYLKHIDVVWYNQIKAAQAYKSLITLLKKAETPVNAAFQVFENYRNEVLNGSLYDRFMDLPQGDPLYGDERDKIKKSFLTVMYNVPVQGKRGNGKKYIDAYPDVFELFNILKSVEIGEYKRKKVRLNRNIREERILKHDAIAPDFGNDLIKYPCQGMYEEKAIRQAIKDHYYIDKGYTKLATILQRVESHLLLDVVCRNINKKYPDIPLVTIHDSIATTEEYLQIVEDEINNILIEAVGYAPKLKREDWAKELVNAG